MRRGLSSIFGNFGVFTETRARKLEGEDVVSGLSSEVE